MFDLPPTSHGNNGAEGFSSSNGAQDMNFYSMDGGYGQSGKLLTRRETSAAVSSGSDHDLYCALTDGALFTIGLDSTTKDQPSKSVNQESQAYSRSVNSPMNYNMH